MEGIFSRYAERYAKAGFAVFPRKPGSRFPLKGSHGHLDATTDLEQVRAWAREYPAANIGIRTGAASGVSVIDVDLRNGGFETEAALAEKGWAFPTAATVRTKGSGRHYWLRHHPLLKFSQTAFNEFGGGIDILGENAAVMAPPSAVDGRGYAWIIRPQGGRAGLPEGPAWLLRHLQTIADKRAAEEAERAKNTVRIDPASLSVTRVKRFAGLARFELGRQRQKIADAVQPGRSCTLRIAACRMAPYVRAGLINESEVRAAFEDAARQCGLVRDNGINDTRATITRAFRTAKDGLPDLDQLPDRARRAA
jgi:putative DNA primase/helicase